MSDCQKNDGGHEPLHTFTSKHDDRDDHPLMHWKIDPKRATGPSGSIHACKHCGLLYFVVDQVGKN